MGHGGAIGGGGRSPVNNQAPAFERLNPEKCPECGSLDIIEDWQAGMVVCRGCGLVLSERLLDLGFEKRTFADDEGEDPNRVSAPSNPLLDSGVGTDIRKGTNSTTKQYKSMNRVQRSKTSAADKQMLAAIASINSFCERMTVTSASDLAKELFKNYRDRLTLKADGSRTRSLRKNEAADIIAACIFIACRNLTVARTFKEMSALTGVATKVIGATVKKIELAIPSAKTSRVRKAGDFLSRFCRRLNLPTKVTNAADQLSRKVHENALYGKTYTTVAAASIFVVTQLCEQRLRRTAAQIAEVTGVAEATIRSTYRQMYPHLSELDLENFEAFAAFETLPRA